MKRDCTENCEILDWDTAFFGFRVGRVRGDTLTQEKVGEIGAWCQYNDIRLLYFLACSNDPVTTRIAEDNGFRLVDVRMTFAVKISSPILAGKMSPACLVAVRQALPEDATILGCIARESHRDSRFFFDENIPLHLSKSLYETWIKKSCNGYADAVLVAVLSEKPVGYISCHLYEERGISSVGLIGVSKSERGMGIGPALLKSAIEWFAERGIKEITVVTQGRNLTAQRLYQRFGFLTKGVQLWYHKWYSNSERDR
jgi:dTDP-4-amino-4,6-dideoxy-D-galactose acyltransferase